VERFYNNARAMTVKDELGKIKTAGAAIGTYDNVAHAPDIMSLLFLQNGVDFNNLQASLDRVQGAFTFYTSFAKDVNNVWDNTLDPSTLAFSKGNLGMFFGYSKDYFTIKQFNPNLSFQIVPVPQLPNQNITLASYWVEGVSQKSKHQKEALLFMKFLAKKETLLKLYSLESKTRDFGEPFARIDLADNLKNNANVYTFVSQAPDARSSFFVDSTNDNGLNQQLNTYLGNGINSMMGNESAEDTAQTFIDGVLQILPKN
jgi:ABC-type glycerol-3-phosphate transport system substrate-binding protein